jgi:hypothetical protein
MTQERGGRGALEGASDESTRWGGSARAALLRRRTGYRGRMGYKLLGFLVWRGAKWYLGRRLGPHAAAKTLAAGGGAALAAAAIVFAARRLASGQ